MASLWDDLKFWFSRLSLILTGGYALAPMRVIKTRCRVRGNEKAV
jgi:hypothetical protein